ncbi:hypothetical protein EVAR_27888_1 [Eumeta japonica]|uniref:Uncharacterized protein n=1 Tax=Eumeta variegata TaxID=151549 RepID=A0A4C1UW84_EUMVA|nr:hypothetical protein EVAR_27888_1 [Eumeta japonica]
MVDFYDEALSLATIHNSFNEFKRGPIKLTDDLREGRPSTAATEDNIVLCMIETDKRVIYQEICTSLGFDSITPPGGPSSRRSGIEIVTQVKRKLTTLASLASIFRELSPSSFQGVVNLKRSRLTRAGRRPRRRAIV